MDISTQKAKQYFALFYRYPQKVFQKCLMKPHEKSIYLCHTKIYKYTPGFLQNLRRMEAVQYTSRYDFETLEEHNFS